MEGSRRSTTGAPKAQSRLLLRVHSAKGLPHTTFSQGVYCKLYLGDTPMTNGSEKSLFGKKSVTEATSNGADDNASSSHGKHRIFRTKIVPHADAESPVVWDENFDVVVMDASNEILSVRVKSKHRLYPSVLGVCAIQLKRMKAGQMVDKWFPLMKGQREVASLRLQLILTPLTDAQKTKERHGVQADILIARAANHVAADAIDRLVDGAQKKRKPQDEYDLPLVRPATSDGAAPVYSA